MSSECRRFAYCFIAKKYMKIAKNHQILGLTASPGSTEGKINEIKENLFVDHVEIRTDQDSDVKPYIYKVDNEWINVKLPREFMDNKKITKDTFSNEYRFEIISF